jgi:hypothetical protein
MTIDKLNGSEKRVFSRVECLVDLEVVSEQQRVRPETVEAVDLSLLGVGFERSKDEPVLQLGTPVTVSMVGLRPVEGRVRWNRGNRVGVQFCGRFQDIVDSWVGEVLAAQGVRIQDLFSLN